MAATVTGKRQVTIPRPGRDLLGIKAGGRFDFERARGLSTGAIMALTLGESE